MNQETSAGNPRQYDLAAYPLAIPEPGGVAQTTKHLSPQKLAANRANAVQSTGPRTARGKHRSSRNALTHGLLSREALLPDEDPGTLAAFAERVRAAFQPVGEEEALQVELITRALWQLRRTGRIEAGIFAWHLARAGADPGETGERNGLALGRTFIRDASAADALSKLSRYQTAIERRLDRSLHHLERLRHARRGGIVTPPIAIDVSVSGTARPVLEEGSMTQWRRTRGAEGQLDESNQAEGTG